MQLAQSPFRARCGHHCSHNHGLRAATSVGPAPAKSAPQAPSGSKGPGQEETFSYNPQDRSVFDSQSRVIPNISVGSKGPENDFVMLGTNLSKENGAYVYPEGDPRQARALAFSSAAKVIDAFREVYAEDFKWAFNFDKLLLRHNQIKDLNANYKRDSGTINTFEDIDPVTKKVVDSGASAEIVAHEVGHALLDAIRPEYFSAWGPEAGAFHEAFGDMMAIHISLMDDRVVKQLVAETGGDLGKPNLVAHLAEELGSAVNHQKGSNHTGGNYLRNANNTLKFSDPAKLKSEKGGPDELGWGKHSLSRVWTGAHFDLLKAMVAERRATGMAPEQAIEESNKELFKMLANMLKEAPRARFGFRDMALAFVQSDKIHGSGQRAALIQKCFTERDILPRDLAPELLERDEASRRSMGANRIFQSQTEEAYEVQEVVLGDKAGMLSGAVVEVPVSYEERIFKSEGLQRSLERDIDRLMKSGKILVRQPHEPPNPDLTHNSKGEVYEGIVTWTDGRMRLERTHISC